MQAQVSAVGKELREEMKEMREKMRRNSSHVAPVRVTDPRVRAQHPPARERGYTPRADLWFFLRTHGEDMGRWDGKPTSALAARGWKHSPTICNGLIQAALEKGEAPEHLQYINDIIAWGNTAMEVFEKGEKIIQILLEAGFAIKQSKVKGPAWEIQFLGVKWQDGQCQIPTEVINKITAMSPPTSNKETQAFLGAIGFWRMHIPEYSQIVSPLYLVTLKKNDFHWGPEQQQAFAQIKQDITHAVALGPVKTGPEVKNMLYSAAGNNGLSWSLWQKVPVGPTTGILELKLQRVRSQIYSNR
ncbi:hypothetical protein DUI87_23764 [Hirundo rustica rustica]|uniref:Reverse transcriptase/retrotransposon-derived protein RNase H-like domain-containing protein n=1 Tax=Hirundo rustica rustica TaxID=333673 RepID=A0A3M0JFN9_HIRRU|nr:hypothetical protein DUI87_23764 [Hirundo rustica rustica]